MTELGRCRKPGPMISLCAAALLLASASAGAQTTPPAEPLASPPPAPPPAPTPPAPPPPAATAPAPPATGSFPTIGPSREIRLSDHWAIRVGLQTQVWYDASQDTVKESDGDDGGYSYNFFLRRARILLGAQPWDDVNIFILVEGSNLGVGTGLAADPKNFGSIAFREAYTEIKLHDAFLLEAGLMLVPVSRNILQATSTYISLDAANVSAQTLGALQTSLMRDVGLQLKGMLLNDRLEYRLSMFSGIREAPATTPPTETGAQNTPRFNAYLQYNFLDPDKGYVFNAIHYGKKRVLGLAASADYQKGRDLDAYSSFSVAAFAAIPIHGPNKLGADEVQALAQFIRYDGGETAPSLLPQNDILFELGYYHHASKLSVFGKYEARMMADEANEVLNQRWYGGGVKYHLIENLLNFALGYTRTELPDAPTEGMGARSSGDQFTFVVQALLF